MEDRTVCEAAKEGRCLCASSKDLLRREDLTGQAEQAFPNLMPLMNTAFVPGKCLEYIRGMKKGPKKDIAFAEYHYFSGHPREAAQETEMYLTCGDPELRLSACLIYAYSNLSVGQIQRARYGLEEIKDTLKADTERTPHARSIEGFISAAAEQFRGCCNEFFWSLCDVAKGIFRDELPFAMATYYAQPHHMLEIMLGWHIGSRTDYSVSCGKQNKYFKRYLPETIYRLYQQPFRSDPLRRSPQGR